LFFGDCQFNSLEKAELQYQKVTGDIVKKIIS
jgi:hypothetical protein